ncbi:MAG: tetratricopeptide repeat protein [Ignavibacteria bacterium]
MNRTIIYIFFLTISFTIVEGCNYVTHRTISRSTIQDEEDIEPDYATSLNKDYQDFVSYIYLGNRSETFSTFFNKFFTAEEDFNEALQEYRSSVLASYNRRLDSLNITPPLSASAKEKFNKVIERCSKIIQYNKNTKFLDAAVLLIGKSYFYIGEYLQAERKFSEFASKLTNSIYYEEAILFLAKTKVKLNNISEAEVILKNLLQIAKDQNIKAEIFQELAFISIIKKDFAGSIDYFKNSINLTSEKDTKAERFFILARIYTLFDPKKAYNEYINAEELASDFELIFYSKLNQAKLIIYQKDFQRAELYLRELSSEYRDYPDLRNQVELELGNNYFDQHKFDLAREIYYHIIYDYSGSKSSADAYYKLAYWYEYFKNDYFRAFICYKKCTETNSFSDYYSISLKKTAVLDRYFNLLAIISGIDRGPFPDDDPDYKEYKKKRDEENTLFKKKIELPDKGQNPKGGGVLSIDTTKKQRNKDSIFFQPQDTSSLIIPKTDSLTQHQKDSIAKVQMSIDSLLAIQREDSVRAAKENKKMEAIFEMAELFLYELNRPDSAEFYLSIVINTSKNLHLLAKAYYALATLYKNQGKESISKDYFQKILEAFPDDIIANEVRKILGLNIVTATIDTTEKLYLKAEEYILSKNFTEALSLLKNTITYSGSSVYQKSLYAIGWIFENYFHNKDSALTYYNRLIKEFPSSSYSETIKAKVEFWTNPNKEKVEEKDTTKTLDTLSNSIDNKNTLQQENFPELNLQEEQKQVTPTEGEAEEPTYKPEN